MSENETIHDSATAVVSISKLMELFRESLLVLVPELDKAQILWESYDEFEEIETISESLFNLIVANYLKNYVNEKYGHEPNLAKYGFYLKDYANLDSVEVTVEDSDSRFIFIMLASMEGPFDRVLCNLVDEKGAIVQRDLEFKWENVDFTFKFKK